MCRIGVISWPINNNSPKQAHVVFGELYLKSDRENEKLLRQIDSDTKQFLYPLKCRKTETGYSCDNEEDLNCLRNRYRLTQGLKVVGINKNIITLRSPRLYDLDCLVPVINDFIQPSDRSEFLHSVSFFIPNIDPIIRGRMAKLVQTEYIILPHVRLGKNKNYLSTLWKRTLKKQGNNSVYIINNINQTNPLIHFLQSGLDCVSDVSQIDQVFIFCSSDQINKINKIVRRWRKHHLLKFKLGYVVVEN
jgi:hypothetical protein